MKRIKLTHGTARVSDNISEQTIEALNKLSEMAYKLEPKQGFIHIKDKRVDTSIDSESEK